MFGDINGSAAVFTTERKALGHTQRDQGDRSGNADCVVVRQQADEERRQAHDQDRDQERVLTADKIAETAEHERAEWAHEEACGEGEQGVDGAGVGRERREELGTDDACQRTVEVKIIPFENRTGGGGENDLHLFTSHASCPRWCRGVHCSHWVSPRSCLSQKSTGSRCYRTFKSPRLWRYTNKI